MENICKLVRSLPPELSSYFLNTIIQTLFSKTEIIRFLLLNEEYCQYISIHDLVITITKNGYLKLDEDILSTDIINLRDLIFGDLKSFINLFENHTLSIKTLIIHANIEQLTFLSKYATKIQCESLNSLSISINQGVDINKLKVVNLSFYKNKFDQFQELVRNIISLNENIEYNLDFMIIDHYDFKETIKIIHFCRTKLKSQFKFTFKILFMLTIPITDNESQYPISKLVKYFPYCISILQKYKIYKNDIKIIMKSNLTDSLNSTQKYNKLCELSNFIGLDIINKFIVESLTDDHYNFNFCKIQKFNNLKLLEIKADQDCNFQTFGNLKNLKLLKKIIFQCDNVDYNWLSTCLPINIETIKLFVTFPRRNHNKTIFKIPQNLKNLVLETDDPNTTIDFQYFNFNNDINLEKIIILNYFIKNSKIYIVNLYSIPKSLKEFRFHDSNDFSCSLNENCFIFESYFDNKLMSGVYSNIDVEFSKFCKCFCNYSLRILNLKSQRIRNMIEKRACSGNNNNNIIQDD
ncbi:hypothetical protein C6P40_003646 [Pichia californica]|uniref:Uncharacterized protein n=1 Tax=Pichia californica TaxID=460514 RepID=A0A9P6WQA8_9ASCO|nr:hypothetical protein C6P42_004167 [[Candida] californica]KAG0690178.1 hypothetical protein C6P40_003646 [[Candida] californica]